MDKWGGAIELFILAQHFGREIAAYDIRTKRCDVYGQGNGKRARRCCGGQSRRLGGGRPRMWRQGKGTKGVGRCTVARLEWNLRSAR